MASAVTPLERALLARLSAESAIRGVLGRYMQLCDNLDCDTPMDELAALFTRDATWTGIGSRYASAFGEHQGRDAIVAMLGRYRGPPPHFSMNAHFLSSETIEVENHGAVGCWSMLQTSTYADGRSDLRAARLRVDFAEEGGVWRIARFETHNIFGRAVARWDDGAPVYVPTTNIAGDNHD